MMDIYMWQIVLAIIVIVSIARFIYLALKIGDRGQTLHWFDPFTMGFALISMLAIGSYLFYQLISWLIPTATDFLVYKVYP